MQDLLRAEGAHNKIGNDCTVFATTKRDIHLCRVIALGHFTDKSGCLISDTFVTLSVSKQEFLNDCLECGILVLHFV